MGLYDLEMRAAASKRKGIELVAVEVRDGVRYEKDLMQHFWAAPILKIFVPINETDAVRRKWATNVTQVP